MRYTKIDKRQRSCLSIYNRCAFEFVLLIRFEIRISRLSDSSREKEQDTTAPSLLNTE